MKKLLLILLCLPMIGFGQCISGDCENGNGTYTLANGDKYVGAFKGGYFTGGVYVFTTGKFKGDKYEGEFKYDKMHGNGTYTFANGNIYVGEWKDGMQDGQGTETFANGTVLKGLWLKGKFIEQGMVLNEDYHEFFKKVCDRAFSTEKGLKMNHFKGSNSDAFCACWTENIFTNYTKTELEKMYNDAISSNANYYEASYIVFNYPNVKEITIDCMQDESFRDDSYIDLNPEKLSIFIKQCKDDLKNGFTTNQEYNEFKLSVDINSYCECYMKDIITEFTINEMMNLEKDPINRVKRDKIQESCIINNLK